MDLLLIGAMGCMGQEVIRVAAEENSTHIIPVDRRGECYLLDKIGKMKIDAILDFSHHSATLPLLQFAKERHLPLVIATTGHTEKERAAILEAACHIPLLLSENLSCGGWLMMKLGKEIAGCFPNGRGEILEIHRVNKADMPSGTAKRLKAYVEKEAHNSIPIHSLRLGDTVGIHALLFDNGDERITLTHQVHNRRLFARGGLSACAFLLDKQPGLYRIEDMAGEA